MVNPNSELFHEHPDWVIAQPKRELELQRNQLVLDLTRPEVQQFEWNSISNILERAGHQLCEMGLQPLPDAAGFVLSRAPTASRIFGLITSTRFTR